MRLAFWKAGDKIGMMPGSLVHVGEKREEKVRMTLIDYDDKHVEERELATIDECFACRDTKRVSWINVDGLHDTSIVERLGKHFAIHPLIMEDILNTYQRPKVEEYDDHLFMVVRMISFDEEQGDLETEQVSFVLGTNMVMTFQERKGDVFEGVRHRIRGSKGRIRKMGAAYLAYALLDAIVDNYFVVLERISEKIEVLETEVMGDPTQQCLHDIHRLKRSVSMLRRSIGPLREVMASLSRGESKLFDGDVTVFLRDLYDHSIRVTDAIDTYREVLSGLMDVYLSSVSNRMNQVMKVLTVFASTFIPLTFIAGIYGMNFEYMPELKWRYSYPLLLLLMAGLGTTMLVIFKIKGWIFTKKD